MKTTIATAWNYLGREVSSWSRLLAVFFLLFILTTTIINLAYGIFRFDLIPVFENTLGEIRRFLHTAFEYLLYRPLDLVVSWLMLIAFDIHFSLPRPAEWYWDLALFSMILSRAERAAMKIAQPIDGRSDVRRSFFEKLIWAIVLGLYLPTKTLLLPFRKCAPVYIYEPIRVLLDGVTLLGIFFLLHDYSILRSHKGQNDPAIQSHRVFLGLMALSIAAAVVASAIFFVLNGYLHHYF